MTRRFAFRGRWYWFGLSLRHGYVEFGRRRLVWHIFTVPHEPPRVRDDEVTADNRGRS